MLAIEVNHKWDVCPSRDSTQAPVHPHIKLSKYRTRFIWTWWKLAWRYSHVSSGALFLIYEFVQACPLLQKGLGHLAALLLLLSLVTCCSLQFTLLQNYLLPLILVLAENTLLKTAYHFLLLLVGFDTITYQKDYDRSPILVGHQLVKPNR